MKTVTFYEFEATNPKTKNERINTVVVSLDTLQKAQRAQSMLKDMGWTVGPIHFPQHSVDTNVYVAVAEAQRILA